tara:strand:- start:1443 stop:1544 length:102 start_codon:yes stop_codon:yes gene_type:complete
MDAAIKAQRFSAGKGRNLRAAEMPARMATALAG